jgi:hypothetical protein
VVGERDSEDERQQRADADERGAHGSEPQQRVDLARPLATNRSELERPDDGGAREKADRAEQMEEEQDVGHRHEAPTISRWRPPTGTCGC